MDAVWKTGPLLVRDAVTDDVAPTQLAPNAWYHKWSSTGSYLAYATRIPGTVHVLRADGGSEVLSIAANEVRSDFVFSAADTFLAYRVNLPGSLADFVRLHRTADASTANDWSFEVGVPPIVRRVFPIYRLPVRGGVSLITSQ